MNRIAGTTCSVRRGVILCLGLFVCVYPLVSSPFFHLASRMYIWEFNSLIWEQNIIILCICDENNSTEAMDRILITWLLWQMKHAFALTLHGCSRSLWNYVMFSLHFLWGHTACRQWARQILIWEVLFTATDYVGLQIRHVKIVTIMLFDKIYCISTFCRGYLISLASFSARLLWRLT